MSNNSNRRDFLKASGAGLVAASTFAAPAIAARNANDKLVVGVIGTGSRGRWDAGNFQKVPNVELAYVCDVDENRRGVAAKTLGVDPSRVVTDMRKILDDKAVDAVIITTPDHWHSPAAILACEAGKHVYVEKPISHNIREGRVLVETAERTKRLVQHGTQPRSTAMIMQAVKQMRDGLIGDVLVARCWNIQRRRGIGRGQPSEAPAGLDYANWVGPAQMVPYQTNRCHDGWHWWYNFGTGDMGNDGVHDVDYCRWGLGVTTHPTKITAVGGKYFFDDDQEFPDTQQVTCEYPGDGNPGSKRIFIYEQRLWSTNYPHNTDSGAEFYGTKGQLFVSRRGKIELRSEKNVVVETDIAVEKQDDEAHVRNFCEAIRDGAKLNADAMEGHLSASLCHLGNIAIRLGRSLAFDPQKEQFVGDAEANALVGREYRNHWGTPRVA